MSERHTCYRDDGGTPNRTCYACKKEEQEEAEKKVAWMKTKLCQKHPKYQAKRQPRSLCEACWKAWFQMQDYRKTMARMEQLTADCRAKHGEGWVWGRRGCRPLGEYDG